MNNFNLLFIFSTIKKKKKTFKIRFKKKKKIAPKKHIIKNI